MSNRYDGPAGQDRLKQEKKNLISPKYKAAVNQMIEAHKQANRHSTYAYKEFEEKYIETLIKFDMYDISYDVLEAMMIEILTSAKIVSGTSASMDFGFRLESRIYKYIVDNIEGDNLYLDILEGDLQKKVLGLFKNVQKNKISASEADEIFMDLLFEDLNKFDGVTKFTSFITQALLARMNQRLTPKKATPVTPLVVEVPVIAPLPLQAEAVITTLEEPISIEEEFATEERYLELIRSLPPLEKVIIWFKHYNEKELTEVEIAKFLNIDLMQVNQILNSWDIALNVENNTKIKEKVKKK